MSELNLSATQLERYARQLVLDGFGSGGQAGLREARILVVGAGGLGSPVLMYLAGAGVGTLGIIDDDRVERSNLHRQLLHGEDDIGRPKVASASDWINSHNPDVEIRTYNRTLDLSSVGELIPGYDLVVDATDRFESRFLINDACTVAEIPFVHGAVYRFEGQVITFDPARAGPCYRCLFPEAPPPGTVPDCATAGVLGPVPGIVGSIQASEAIKHASGIGDSPLGRLLLIDTLGLHIDAIDIEHDPTCPVCATDTGIESLDKIAYDDRYRIVSA